MTVMRVGRFVIRMHEIARAGAIRIGVQDRFHTEPVGDLRRRLFRHRVVDPSDDSRWIEIRTTRRIKDEPRMNVVWRRPRASIR